MFNMTIRQDPENSLFEAELIKTEAKAESCCTFWPIINVNFILGSYEYHILWAKEERDHPTYVCKVQKPASVMLFITIFSFIKIMLNYVLQVLQQHDSFAEDTSLYCRVCFSQILGYATIWCSFFPYLLPWGTIALAKRLESKYWHLPVQVLKLTDAQRTGASWREKTGARL